MKPAIAITARSSQSHQFWFLTFHHTLLGSQLVLQWLATPSLLSAVGSGCSLRFLQRVTYASQIHFSNFNTRTLRARTEKFFMCDTSLLGFIVNSLPSFCHNRHIHDQCANRKRKRKQTKRACLRNKQKTVQTRASIGLPENAGIEACHKFVDGDSTQSTCVDVYH